MSFRKHFINFETSTLIHIKPWLMTAEIPDVLAKYLCHLDELNMSFAKKKKKTFGNKDANQPCSNCTADQHVCFHFMDITVLFLV